MQSSNGHNILGGFGICPQENFRHRESSEMQFGGRNNFLLLLNITLTPRAFYTALMQSIIKLLFFKALKA